MWFFFVLHEGMCLCPFIAAVILSLGRRPKWVVSFTFRPLYLYCKCDQQSYRSNRRLNSPLNRSGRFCRKLN